MSDAGPPRSVSARRARAPFCRRVALLAALLVATTSGSVLADAGRTAFRPCIDPSNLPFANEKGEGFENRIADLSRRSPGSPSKAMRFRSG
jgi:hypothetical protein